MYFLMPLEFQYSVTEVIHWARSMTRSPRTVNSARQNLCVVMPQDGSSHLKFSITDQGGRSSSQDVLRRRGDLAYILPQGTVDAGVGYRSNPHGSRWNSNGCSSPGSARSQSHVSALPNGSDLVPHIACAVATTPRDCCKTWRSTSNRDLQYRQAVARKSIVTYNRLGQPLLNGWNAKLALERVGPSGIAHSL